MQTQPTANPTPDWAGQPRLFEDLGPRQVVADFTGRDRSADGGVRLLRQAEHGLGLARTLAAGFHDTRAARFVEQAVR